MSVKSMTGFARVRRELPEGELVVSLKSVNHRGLDLHFHIPASLDAFEPAIRMLLKSRVSRGHVQTQISFSGNRNGNSSVNYELLETWLKGFREASEKYHLKCEPDLNEAMYVALESMLSWLQHSYQLDKSTALALASPTVDLRVTQVANQSWGVHALLPWAAITEPHPTA